MSSPLNPLTKSQQEFCTWAGVSGALISASALIQHMIYMIPGTLTYLMLLPYLFIIFSFCMLAAQQLAASVLMIIASVFALCISILFVFGGAFSPLVIIQLLCCIIVTIYLFMENIPEKLRRKKMMEQAEEDLWKGRI